MNLLMPPVGAYLGPVKFITRPRSSWTWSSRAFSLKNCSDTLFLPNENAVRTKTMIIMITLMNCNTCRTFRWPEKGSQSFDYAPSRVVGRLLSWTRPPVSNCIASQKPCSDAASENLRCRSSSQSVVKAKAIGSAAAGCRKWNTQSTKWWHGERKHIWGLALNSRDQPCWPQIAHIPESIRNPYGVEIKLFHPKNIV